MVVNSTNIVPTLHQLLVTSELTQAMIKRHREWREIDPTTAPYNWDSETKACLRTQQKIREETAKLPLKLIQPSDEDMMKCLEYIFTIAIPDHKKKMISFNYISRNFIKIFESAGLTQDR
jgi:hypothetical protein